MTDLKKFPVKLAVEQDDGKFYVYGSHITNFNEVIEKIEETNGLLETNNTLLVDANGHLTDINGNLIEIDGELVSLNTVEGTVTDAAVTGDNPGTISAKLRGLNTQTVQLLSKNDDIIDRIEETNTLLTANNALLVDANGHLVDVNGNLVEIDGELVSVNTVEGLISDAAVTAGDAGTISGKLRRISADISQLKDNQANGTQLVGGVSLTVPFTTTTAQAVGTTDAANFSGVSVEINTQGTNSVVTFQVSDDNINWRSFNMVSVVNTTVAPSTSTTSGSFANALPARYFRVNVTGITAGTTEGVIVFKNVGASSTIVAGQQGTWTVGANSATGSAFPASAFAQGGKALIASPTAATANQLTAITLDAMGEQLVTSGGLVTTAVPANASNTVIKATRGRLCRVLVTGTGANSMVIHDNATTNSGTVIGTLPANAPVGSVYDFQMPAANGITISGSATNPSVTVSWI